VYKFVRSHKFQEQAMNLSLNGDMTAAFKHDSQFQPFQFPC